MNRILPAILISTTSSMFVNTSGYFTGNSSNDAFIFLIICIPISYTLIFIIGTPTYNWLKKSNLLSLRNLFISGFITVAALFVLTPIVFGKGSEINIGWMTYSLVVSISGGIGAMLSGIYSDDISSKKT